MRVDFGKFGSDYELWDTDHDTGIEVERTADWDKVAFNIGGLSSDPVLWDGSGLIFNNTRENLPIAMHGVREDNVFYLDAANDSVALGTDDSTYLFRQVAGGVTFTVRPRNLIQVGDIADQVTFATRRWSNTATAAGQIEFLRARNNETIVQNGDRVGGFRMSAWDGEKYIGSTGIYSEVDGVPGVDLMPIGVRIIVGTFATTAATAFKATSGNIVGFRTSVPVSELTFEGNAVFNYSAVAKSFRVAGSSLANLFNITSAGNVQVGGTSAGTIASFTPTVITLNEGGTDINLRMESTSYQRILFMDAGLNTIGFGTANGDEWLYAGASEVVINDRSGTVNFRAETDSNTHQFFVNATANRTGFNNTNPVSTAHFIGSFGRGSVTKTGTYTLTESDYRVFANGTFTLNLPTAVGCIDREYNIINIGTGVITIDASGTETINGNLTWPLAATWDTVTIVSDGANWIIT